MSGFNFRKKEDLVAVKRLLNRREPFTYNQGTVKHELLSEGYLFLTPAGGIPARVGNKAGKAECTPYYINGNDELTELLDNDGNTQTVTVYHIHGAPVSGDTYIQAKKVFRKIVADTEDCTTP